MKCMFEKTNALSVFEKFYRVLAPIAPNVKHFSFIRKTEVHFQIF